MNNRKRKNYGRAAVRVGCDTDAADKSANIVDTLANIMHYAHGLGLDARGLSASAGRHFEAEIGAAACPFDNERAAASGRSGGAAC